MDKIELEKCPGCKSRLLGPVKYCPFCGKQVKEIPPPPLPFPKYGPITKGLTIGAPGESGAVEVTAVAHSEDGLNIAGAEWWIGDDPGPGKGNAMKAVDGSFKSSRADIRASIETSQFGPGNHPVNVRSKDIRGEWGSPQTATLTVLTREETKPDDDKETSGETEVGDTGGPSSPESPPPTPPDRHLLRNAIVGILIAACLFIGYKIISKPKEKAQLFVSTSPSGASLKIDGQDKGRTPITGISLDSGTHHIVLERNGYSRAEQDISLGPGEKKSLVVTLEKKSVDSAEMNIITTPDQAVVFIDGNRKGTTPLTLKNITPGEHSLTISKAGYENRNERINIASGEKKSVEYALTQIPIPAKATLSVNTSPSGAQVTVDGIQVGKTLVSIQDMAPGEHSLTISKAGYENRNERINIASGEKKSVEYALIPIRVEETATLYVNTAPPGAYLSVDGVRSSGTTPVFLPKLSIGRHVIAVVKPGYESKEEIVSLSKGDKKGIRIILTATGGDAKKDIEDDLKEAVAAFNNFQYDVAIKICQSILRRDPNNSTAQQYLQKAREEQEKAINKAVSGGGSIKKIK
jgi:hypothetical protein